MEKRGGNEDVELGKENIYEYVGKEDEEEQEDNDEEEGQE